MIAPRTIISCEQSSSEFPFEAEFVDAKPEQSRCERVPPQRAWVVPTIVALTTVLIVLGVAT